VIYAVAGFMKGAAALKLELNQMRRQTGDVTGGERGQEPILQQGICLCVGESNAA